MFLKLHNNQSQNLAKGVSLHWGKLLLLNFSKRFWLVLSNYYRKNSILNANRHFKNCIRIIYFSKEKFKKFILLEIAKKIFFFHNTGAVLQFEKRLWSNFYGRKYTQKYIWKFFKFQNFLQAWREKLNLFVIFIW